MDRSLLSGWAKLASTNALAGILQFVAFAVAAHSLEVAALGIIVLIQAYVRVVDSLFNFQSVNVLTRFLGEIDPSENKERFAGLIKAGFAVDCVTALVAFTVAVASAPFLAAYVGIPDDWVVPTTIFAAVILTRIHGVTEAVLRCFDQFWAIGLRGTINGLLLLVGSVFAWWLDAGAVGFLAVWMISEVIANIWFLLWSLIVLRRERVRDIGRADARAAISASEGFWRSLWQTNLTFGLRMLSQEADIIIAGAVLGAAAASLLKAAKNVAALLGQFGRPLQQVASVPIARLCAQRKFGDLLRYASRVSIAGAAAGLLIAGVLGGLGEDLISIIFGSEFIQMQSALLLLVVSKSIYLSGVTHLPVMLALNMSGVFLYGVALGTMVFFAVLIPAVAPMGLVGIALAHIAFEVTWSLYCWYRIVKKTVELETP